MNAVFAIFGLSTSATVAQLNDAYRQAALLHHPDRGGDANEFIKFKNAKNDIEAWWLAMATPSPPPPPTTSAAESTLAIEHAVGKVFQRRPGIPASATINESAFYKHLINVVHTEVTWVRKSEVKAFLYTQPWSSQCQALWTRVVQLKSSPTTTTPEESMQEPAAPPPPPIPEPPAPPSPPETTPQLAPQWLWVQDALPKDMVACPGCDQWAKHCMGSHPSCRRY